MYSPACLPAHIRPRLCVIVIVFGLYPLWELSGLATAQPPDSATPRNLIQELGAHSFRFLGATRSTNEFDRLANVVCVNVPPKVEPRDQPLQNTGSRRLDVFCIVVDTSDHLFNGTDADRTNYINGRKTAIEVPCNDYWKETSFGNLSLRMNMAPHVETLPSHFDDYYNRPFVAASATTRGLAAASFPLTFAATDQVRLVVSDAFNRTTDVTFTPPATVVDLNQLHAAWSAKMQTLPIGANAVSVTIVGGELQFALRNDLVAEGSSIRVKDGADSVLSALGLNGPRETPGGGSPAMLVGRPIKFPLNLAFPALVDVEIRDKDFRTRRYTVSFAPGINVTAQALATTFNIALNSHFDWIQANATDRLILEMKSSFSGANAAVRIVGGQNLASLGLEGPDRIDGVVTEHAQNGIRGDSGIPIGEALSRYFQRRAAALGIPVDAAHKPQLDQLINNELNGFDAVMLLFADIPAAIPPPLKRAWATAPTYSITLDGVDGFKYSTQRQSATVIGEGSDGWQAFAHEFGHVLGCFDLYRQPWHDPNFNSQRVRAGAWSLMDFHPFANHVEGWHKRLLGYTFSGVVRDVFPPLAATTEHNQFTLTPLEYPDAEYSSFGDLTFHRAQLICIHLNSKHWIGVENRQPGVRYSRQLPDEFGDSPPAGADHGGVLVTDNVDPFNVLYRPPVAILNPDAVAPPALPAGATRQARGLRAGDSFLFNSTFPRYAGLRLDVVEEIPGPPGRPSAFKVDVVWGPGDFLDLEIRPWQAPGTYATPDIWIDWPGNGDNNFPGVDPPLGGVDSVHWHPEGKVVNKIKVRVHNRGTILGRNVVVRAKVNDPIGVGDRGNFVPLPDSAPQDIPAGQARDFVFDWAPIKAGHTCIRAEIFTDSSDLSDLDLENNYAQENVTDFAPSAGSPYEPFDFAFKVNNSQNRVVEAEIIPAGLNEGMELELEQKYLRVPPQQSVSVRGRLQLDTSLIPLDPSKRKSSYCFNIHAFQRTRDSIMPWGGISVSVEPGARCKLQFDSIKRGELDQFAVFGRLVGPYPRNETVDAAFVASDTKVYQGSTKTKSAGHFQVPLGFGVPRGDGTVMIYYNGKKMAATYLGPVDASVP